MSYKACLTGCRFIDVWTIDEYNRWAKRHNKTVASAVDSAGTPIVKIEMCSLGCERIYSNTRGKKCLELSDNIWQRHVRDTQKLVQSKQTENHQA